MKNYEDMKIYFMHKVITGICIRHLKKYFNSLFIIVILFTYIVHILI